MRSLARIVQPARPVRYVQRMLGLVLSLTGSLAAAQSPLWQGREEPVANRQSAEAASPDAVDYAVETAGVSRGQWWYAARPRVWVRSAADERAYPTSVLSLGAAVEVYRTTADGWAAIRPPEGAFAWVPAEALYLQAGGGQGQVRQEGTPAWIGSLFGTPIRYRSQIDLAAGQPVTVIDRMSVTQDDGKELVWLAISPPPGEFRWVRLTDLSRQPPGAVGTGTRELEAGVRLASSQSVASESSRLSEGLIMSDYFLLEGLEEPPLGGSPEELALVGEPWWGAFEEGQAGVWMDDSELQLQPLIQRGRVAPPGVSGGRVDRHQPLGRWGASVGGAQPHDTGDDPQWDSWSWLGEKQQFQQAASESQPIPGILGIIGFRTVRPGGDPWHHALPGHPDVQPQDPWDQKQRAHQSHRERPPGLLDGGWPMGTPMAWLWPSPPPMAAPVSQLEYLPRPTPRSRRVSSGGRPERFGSGADSVPRDDLSPRPSKAAGDSPAKVMSGAMDPDTEPEVIGSDAAAEAVSPDARGSDLPSLTTQVGWHAIAGPLPGRSESLAATSLPTITASHMSDALRVSTPQARQLLEEIERSLAGPTTTFSWEQLWQSANALVESDAGPVARGEGRLLRQYVEQLHQQEHRRISPAAGSLGRLGSTASSSRVPASTVAASAVAVVTGQAGLGAGGSAGQTATSDWLGQTPQVDPAGIQASDASGWLVAVHSDNPNQPPFALTDAAGQLICYLQPMPGANLRRYLRQPVAVYGRRGYLPQLDAKLVTVERIVRLQP